MVDRAVTYNINAKDNASDVFDRVAENLTRSFDRSGSSASDISKRVSELTGKLGLGSKAAGEMSGGIKTLGEGFSATAGRIGKTTSFVGDLISKLKDLKTAGLALGPLAVPVLGAVAIGTVAKIGSDELVAAIDRKTKFDGRPDDRATMADRVNAASRAREEGIAERVAALKAKEATAADASGITAVAGLKFSQQQEAALAALKGTSADRAERELRDRFSQAHLAGGSIDLKSEDEAIARARTNAEGISKALQEAADKSADFARIASQFQSMEFSAQGIRDSSKTGGENFKEQVEEIRRLGQQDLLDFPQQEKAIEELKKKFSAPFLSPRERLGETNKHIDDLLEAGAISPEHAARGKRDAFQQMVGRGGGATGSNNLESRFLTRAPGNQEAGGRGNQDNPVLRDSLTEQKDAAKNLKIIADTLRSTFAVFASRFRR